MPHQNQLQLLLFPTGAELEVMSDMVVTGALSYINLTTLERHQRFETNEERRKAMVTCSKCSLAASFSLAKTSPTTSG